MSRTTLLDPPYADRADALLARMRPGTCTGGGDPGRTDARGRFLRAGRGPRRGRHPRGHRRRGDPGPGGRACRRSPDARRGGAQPHRLALIGPSGFTAVPDGHTDQAVLAAAAGVGTTGSIVNVPLTYGGSE
jgi:hypothetical protein